MRKINILFIFIFGLFALPGFAATCYKQATFYGCSNAFGTTCTKVSVTALIPDTVTAVGSCNLLTVTGSEYTAFVGTTNAMTPLTTRVTNVENRASLLETRATNLENRTFAAETSLTSLANTVGGFNSQISTNTTAVGNLNQILNEPFDLATGMAAFAFFFSTTLFFYGVSRGAGAILEIIKRPLGRG